MANIRKDQTNLEKLRRAKGMTRQNLADATGLTWDKLRSYEIKRSSIKNLPFAVPLSIFYKSFRKRSCFTRVTAHDRMCRAGRFLCALP